MTGCASLTVLDPRGPVGEQERSLIVTAAVLMLIVIVPVIVMTVLFAWRFRAANTRAPYDPAWSHSLPLEIAVWAVPLIIVTILGYLAWGRSHTLDPFRPIASTATPVEVQVVSLDWKWLFIYPQEGVAAVNEMAFPVNTPVSFSVTSDTVMNSFFIPQLGSQIYAMPGMQTQLHLVADHPGRYAGLSANFSGRGFSGMTFTAIATTADGYRQWIAAARASPLRLDRAAWMRLEKPSANAPVAYFSGVQPRLFSEVLREYAGPMAMQ